MHDRLEDTNATLIDIENEFGSRIAQIVYRLTRIRGRKKISIEEITNESYMATYKDAILIKLCDRLHNLQTIEFKIKEKRTKLIKETLKHFLRLALYTENRYLFYTIAYLCSGNRADPIGYYQDLIFQDKHNLVDID